MFVELLLLSGAWSQISPGPLRWSRNRTPGAYIYYPGILLSWENARQWCMDENRILPQICSAEDTYRYLAVARVGSWIGLHDNLREGRFVWSNPPGCDYEKKYQNWGPHEPNNAGRGEDCVQAHGRSRNGKWNDLSCERRLPVVCMNRPAYTGKKWLSNKGASPTITLHECQGDCDNDGDCAGDLKCFQRNGLDAVPGCNTGGQGDVRGFDYCYRRPLTPTWMPTSAPHVVTPEWDDASASRCERCAAHAYHSGKSSAKDGCYNCDCGDGIRICGCAHCDGFPARPFGGVFLHAMRSFGATPPRSMIGKMKECDGDCDADSDCEGSLKCFQRDVRETIPGCRSGGAGDLNGHDYCWDPDFEWPGPSQGPRTGR